LAGRPHPSENNMQARSKRAFAGQSVASARARAVRYRLNEIRRTPPKERYASRVEGICSYTNVYGSSPRLRFVREGKARERTLRGRCFVNSLAIMPGVRPAGGQKSSGHFDRLPGVLILELGWAELA
jgi:hypothetical protein